MFRAAREQAGLAMLVLPRISSRQADLAVSVRFGT